MKYRNTITGAVIDIKSTITEGLWQALESASSVVEENAKVAPVQQKKRKGGQKNE